MELIVDNFRVTTLDEYNFALYKTRAKKALRGKAVEGETEVLIGYYGSLGGVAKKLVSELPKDSDDSYHCQQLLEQIIATEALLESIFASVLPKHFIKKDKK